jgi:hypothetical protein
MSPSRWRVLIGVLVLAVVAVAGGLAYLLLRDTTTPVGVSDAVDRFRDDGRDRSGSSVVAGGAAAELPPPGVYVYATEGQDSIDLLGGSTHTYPAETTLTITHTGCGIRQRWQPLEERWDEEEVCASDAGRERRKLDAHHEFFGIADDQAFRCEEGYLLLPADPEPGATWPTSCRSDDTVLTGTGEVIGLETREVGGVEVETVHVRVEEESTGANTGPSSDDYWLRAGDGLLIERVSTVATRSDSAVGSAAYAERFTLRLTSLTPRT